MFHKAILKYGFGDIFVVVCYFVVGLTVVSVLIVPFLALKKRHESYSLLLVCHTETDTHLLF